LSVPENILDPLIIVFNSEAEVIDTFISESKRPEIVNGKINLNSAENKINIQFDILKKNE